MELTFIRAADYALEALNATGDIAMKFVATNDRVILGDVRSHWHLALAALRPEALGAPMSTQLVQHLAARYEVRSAGDVYRDGRIAFSVHEVYAELGLVPTLGSRAEIEALIQGHLSPIGA